MTVNAVARHFDLLIGTADPCVVELTGKIDSAGLPVRALYAGSGTNRQFLVRLLIDEPQELRASRFTSYSDIADVLASASGHFDAVLTDLPPLRAALTPREAQFRFPAWLRQELLLPEPDTQQRWVLPRQVEREAARHVRRHQYRVDFIQDERNLSRFYHELYKPYIQARFHSGAILVTEAQFSSKARECVLARLMQAGQWVAGMLLEYSRDVVRFGWFGAAGGAPPPGASEVLDVACVREAHARGIRRIVLGHSRPSLVDGVVRYKARLGAQLCGIRYPQAVLGITVQAQHQRLFTRLNGRRIVTMHGRVAHVLFAHEQ